MSWERGEVSGEEEKTYFQIHMGMQFSEDEVDEMIREVDVDGIKLKF